MKVGGRKRADPFFLCSFTVEQDPRNRWKHLCVSGIAQKSRSQGRTPKRSALFPSLCQEEGGGFPQSLLDIEPWVNFCPLSVLLPNYFWRIK
jgi:hypothetical protein